MSIQFNVIFLLKTATLLTKYLDIDFIFKIYRTYYYIYKTNTQVCRTLLENKVLC